MMTVPWLRRSAAFSPEVIAEIDRAADEGLYKIRGFAPSARCRASTIWYCSAPRSRATRLKDIANAVQLM